MDAYELTQERKRDKQNELASMMKQCQEHFDNLQPPAFYATEQDYQDDIDAKYEKELAHIVENIHTAKGALITSEVLSHFAAELAGLNKNDAETLMLVFSCKAEEAINDAVKVLEMAAQRACERLAEERTY